MKYYHQRYQEMVKKIKEENKKPKLLLQVCCAPCSTAVLERLLEYFDVALYFFNPNIFPENEYYKRAEAMKHYLSQREYNLSIIIAEYQPEEFVNLCDSLRDEKEGGLRCKRCFALRLKETAHYAKENGFEYFTTSLSISPHKNVMWINEIGISLGKKYNILFLEADFKKEQGYAQSVSLSKQHEVYRQDYCGCSYSKSNRLMIENNLRDLLELINSRGKGYIVGGTVRDLMIGKPPTDYDVSVSLSYESLVTLLSEYKFKIRSKKLEVFQVKRGEFQADIARLRNEIGVFNHRDLHEFEFTNEIEKDLKRRDFTINAMAYYLTEGLIDPYSGQRDLALKLIRCVGDTKVRFQEDPLRMLRAIRFATQLSFELHESCYNGIIENRMLVERISLDHQRKEFFSILLSENVLMGLRLLRDTGILTILIPEMEKAIGFSIASKHHHLTLDEHIFHVVAHTPVKISLRLAALFHDISKPILTKESGYCNHAHISAQLSDPILMRLGVSKIERERTLELIKKHSDWSQFSSFEIKKQLYEMGIEGYRDLIALFRADVHGKAPPHCFKLFNFLEKKMNKIIESKQAVFLRDLAVKGNDLPSEITPFQRKDILEKTLHEVWKKPGMNQKEKLLAWINLNLIPIIK